MLPVELIPLLIVLRLVQCNLITRTHPDTNQSTAVILGRWHVTLARGLTAGPDCNGGHLCGRLKYRAKSTQLVQQ